MFIAIHAPLQRLNNSEAHYKTGNFSLLLQLVLYFLIKFIRKKNLNLVFSRASSVLENSQSNTRSFNSILKTGDYLQSKNGILKLQLNSNGNLVLYCKDKEIWSTNTSDNSVECLYFGKNRTLSLRKKGNISIWEAEFLGIDSDPKDLTLQDDGNLVVYGECGEILWESKTSGKCNAIPGNLVIQ